MPSRVLVRKTSIKRTARVRQLEGLFDMPARPHAELTWNVTMPIEERDWQLGMIVGPSGSGKSTILDDVFGGAQTYAWDPDKAIVDGFPKTMELRDVTMLLSSVGLASAPAWLRPFHTLSNGEQFRASMARAIAEAPDLAVVDEFTSVVDRTVARATSHAVAKAVRRSGKKLVVAACHYDIVEWLQPDWVYDTQKHEFTWGCLRPRPPVVIELEPSDARAWRIFRQHHYLSSNLLTRSDCIVARFEGELCAFNASTQLLHPDVTNVYRGHRLVVLPDYQGLGVGTAISNYRAACFAALGWRFTASLAHPAMARYYARSPLWKLRQQSQLKDRNDQGGSFKHAHLRVITSFEYVGPPAPFEDARRLYPRVKVRERALAARSAAT